MLGQNDSEISSTSVHAIDAGTHTCNVVDSVGKTGSGSLTMNVYGKFFSLIASVVENSSSCFFFSFCRNCAVCSKCWDNSQHEHDTCRCQ